MRGNAPALEQDQARRKTKDDMESVPDILYPSDNPYDIPCLMPDMQAGAMELPFVPYGTAFKAKTARTVHYYVEDYRFATLWENPAKGIGKNITQSAEVNYSLFDTTPVARGLERIYRKRWLARYWQEQGVRIYVDLNVSAKFYELNLLGVPQGWNAFATRGCRDCFEAVVAEYEIAQRVSGKDAPNMIVYGGGARIHEFCMAHSLLYITDFMSEKGERDNG